MKLKQRWVKEAVDEYVSKPGAANLEAIHVRGRKEVSRRVFESFALSHVDKWSPIKQAKVAGDGSTEIDIDAALEVTQGVLAMLEELCGPFLEKPGPAPQTPADLEICSADTCECHRELFVHRGIDMPSSIPRDAVFIAEELMAAMIGGYSGFHVSDNDKGSHWILWIQHEHWDDDSYCYDPVAVCRKPGVTLERASIYLLRAWWRANSVYDESGDGRRGNTFIPTGGLNQNEFWGLIDELWPLREENKLREVWKQEHQSAEERGKALVEAVTATGIEPFKVPDRYPKISHDEIHLVCWLVVKARGAVG